MRGILDAPASAAVLAGRSAVDLRRLLPPGTALPGDGVTDASGLLQAAVDTLGGLVAAQGPQVLYLPRGRYRLATQLTWTSGVGLRGEDRHGTVLAPTGVQSAIRGTKQGGVNNGTYYDDCLFSDFTIDATDQSGPADSATAKGIYIQFMRRARFERVTIKNTLGTGFGCDYLQDAWMVDCYASGCGRSMVDQNGAGAGFGIGTGFFPDEPCTLVNCVSVDNRSNGFFTENRTSGPTLHSRGFTLLGCRASGNFVGFRDGGSKGAVVANCQLINNRSTGVSVSNTPANTVGGHDGLITGCLISGNGIDAAQSNRHGVLLATAIGGGYTVTDNNIVDNARSGVHVSPSYAGTSLTITRNRIRGHARSGIALHNTSGTLDRVDISDNDVSGNGTDVAEDYRDGVTVRGGLSNPRLTRNGCRGNGAYGIALRDTTKTTSLPRIADNDLVGNSVGPLLTEHTVTSGVLVAGNVLATSGAQVDAVSLAHPPLRSASYYCPLSPAASSTSSVLAVGTARVAPWLVLRPITIDRIGVGITAAGEAGAKVRPIIYADDGSCYPGALLLDAGQLPADAIAAPEATVALSLQPGLYWIGGVVQAVSTTQPALRILSSWTPPVPLHLGASIDTNISGVGYSMTGVTGAPPAQWSATVTIAGSVPRTHVRVA